MRWPSFLSRRPARARREVIHVTTRPDPLVRARAEIDQAITRRAEKRKARPPRTEQRRFAHARPKVEQLVREIVTMPVDF